MRIARLTGAIATVLVVLVASTGSASAASVPGFTVESFALPTNFSASHTAGCNNERQYEHCDAYEVKVSNQNAVGGELPSFGFSNFGFYISGLDGMPNSQAGDHPYEVTTTIGLNNGFRVNNPAGSEISDSTSVQDVKDFVTDVPLGLIGSTLAAPRCTLAQLSAEEGRCPTDTIVGHLRTEPEELTSINSPIWNLVPEKGVAAEFGY